MVKAAEDLKWLTLIQRTSACSGNETEDETSGLSLLLIVYLCPFGFVGLTPTDVEAYVVDNLDTGIVVGLSHLEDLDAVLYPKRRIMTNHGKEVALAYQNGGNSSREPSIYMSISKPFWFFIGNV